MGLIINVLEGDVEFTIRGNVLRTKYDDVLDLEYELVLPHPDMPRSGLPLLELPVYTDLIGVGRIGDTTDVRIYKDGTLVHVRRKDEMITHYNLLKEFCLDMSNKIYLGRPFSKEVLKVGTASLGGSRYNVYFSPTTKVFHCSRNNSIEAVSSFTLPNFKYSLRDCTTSELSELDFSKGNAVLLKTEYGFIEVDLVTREVIES